MSKYINLEKQLVRLYQLNLSNEETIKQFLLTACTEDVEKVRHGHWTLIDKGHNFYDWECSICGGSGRGDYLFCPYCGAVMDEDIPMEYFENGGI